MSFARVVYDGRRSKTRRDYLTVPSQTGGFAMDLETRAISKIMWRLIPFLILFYLTLWFPVVYRARVISLFMLAIPISSIIGSPISGLLLGVTGWGLEGWQWLFILEALPSVLVGIGVLIYLTDYPRQARWLQ